MASLWKDTRSKYWIACFTDRDGRRRKKTTRTTERKKAQKIADELEKVAQTKQTVKRLRESMTGLAREIWGVEMKSVSVREHIEAWLGEKKGTTATSTWEFYSQSTTKFLLFLGESAESPIDEVDRPVMVRFREKISAELSAKTVNHHVKCLKMVFKSAKRDGLIDDNPMEFVETKKLASSASKRPFTVPELQKILAACDPEWRSMVMCAIYSGQRLADIATLRWESIDLKSQEIRLIARKTKRRMAIPLSLPLLQHFEKLKPEHERIGMVHPRAGNTVETQRRSGTLSNQFTAILVAAGLREPGALSKVSKGKGRSAERAKNDISFHSLRHTAVTLLKEAGVPQAVVMEMIGHDSEQMSQHYTHVGKEALAKAAAVLPDLTNNTCKGPA